MRTDLVPAAEALSIILEGASPVETETVPLVQAHGRILARDLPALRTQPPFPASAMDGYALRGADVQTAPVTLTIIGEAAAGHPFAGKVGRGEAVRIFTGAPVPDGADTVQMQENTRRDCRPRNHSQACRYRAFGAARRARLQGGRCAAAAG